VQRQHGVLLRLVLLLLLRSGSNLYLTEAVLGVLPPIDENIEDEQKKCNNGWCGAVFFRGIQASYPDPRNEHAHHHTTLT